MSGVATPTDSTEAKEAREQVQVTLSVRCREVRPNGAPVDAWTEPNVVNCRAVLLDKWGIPESRADKVMLALAADPTVESPRAANNFHAVRRARARVAGKGPKKLPEWCGKCPPEGRTNAAMRWLEDANGMPYKCPDCHPAVAERADG